MYLRCNPDAAHDIFMICWAVVLLGQKMYFIRRASYKFLIDHGILFLDFQEGESVLDVGCGYGPIGLAKLRSCRDHGGCQWAGADLLRKCQPKWREAQIFSFGCLRSSRRGLWPVISNPPIRAGKKVVHQVITGSFEHLKPGGDLTIVIQKNKAPCAKVKIERDVWHQWRQDKKAIIF